MGELATAPQDLARYQKDGFALTTAAMVDRLTAAIDDLEKDKTLYGKGWAMPGNTPLAATLDMARTVCRRAERRVAALDVSEHSNAEILRYLNRLSDLCWLLARFAENKHLSNVGGPLRPMGCSPTGRRPSHIFRHLIVPAEILPALERDRHVPVFPDENRGRRAG